MKEACKQILELAAENADIKIGSRIGWEELKYTNVKQKSFNGHNDSYSEICIDKQSILNTINQSE